MSLISRYIGVNIILHLFREELRQVKHSHSWNMKFLSFLCTKWMENCEAMTSSTHSFAYSWWLVKKCFLKIGETSKCHNFLIFQPIFIRFSLYCSKILALSSEIKLILFWISSLTLSWKGQPSFYHATVALSLQIEIYNLDRTKSSFLYCTSLYKKVIFTKNWVTRSYHPTNKMCISGRNYPLHVSIGALLKSTSTRYSKKFQVSTTQKATRTLLKEIILSGFVWKLGKCDWKSCSRGTEEKDFARIFCDCVLYKENYAFTLALAS